MHLIIHLQITFQAAVATDGKTSFAAFIYDNRRNRFLPRANVGFFGNRRQSYDASFWNLKAENLFRIDGTLLASLANAILSRLKVVLNRGVLYHPLSKLH